MQFFKQLAILSLLLLMSIQTFSQDDRGRLIIVKDKTIFWGKKEMPFYINDVQAGTLPSQTVLRLPLKPGYYKIQTKQPFLSNPTYVEVKSGEPTFVRTFTTPNLSDENALNTTLSAVSDDAGKSAQKGFTEGSYSIEGSDSYNNFVPEENKPVAAVAASPAPTPTTTSSTPPAGGAFAQRLAAMAGGSTTPQAQPAAAAATTNNSGEKSEDEMKAEAVDSFLKDAGNLTAEEVIANNSRQKEMLAIGDLYDFTVNESVEVTTEKSSTYSVMAMEEPPKLEKEFPNLKYRRSSLYTMIINDASRPGYPFILSAFGDSKLPEKFNNHNVGAYLIDGEGGTRDEQAQIENINQYLEANQVAKKLVAKWFNRSPKGGFNMDLISQRGYYNASELDVALAQSNQRGIAILADAGEELIKNTFVLVSDYNFTNKEEVAAKVNQFAGFAAKLAAAAGEDGMAKSINNVSKVVDFVGKGFIVRTRSYLYQLEWNDEIANQFYSQYWTTDGSIDPSRVNAFNQADIFKMKLVGYQAATADLQSTKATKATNAELIRKATIRAQNRSIAKLEKTYEQFRTKTPLYSIEPLTAKIGEKEGVSKGDKFEVLEQVLDSEGRTQYKRREIIEVDPKKIWDNSFGADEEGVAQSIDATHFKGNNKGLYEGMLIRQIN